MKRCIFHVLILFFNSQKPEPAVKEAPNEVIARANAKGILDKLGSNHLTRKEQHENSSRMKKAASVRTTQSQLSVSIQPKHHQTKRSDSAVLCGHQDFTNMKQSSQGGCAPNSQITQVN